MTIANPDPSARSQAPYNFVPQAEAILAPGRQADAIDHSRFADGCYSGAIDVRITTETPLYVRAGVDPIYAQANQNPNDAVWQHGSQYREFRHNGDPARPVIPGSSIRGAIRQIVEVLTASALRKPSDSAIVYRAVGDSSSFGRFYRERFVGPNTLGSKSAAQRYHYPLDAVRGGYLRRVGREWRIRPAKTHHGVSFVHVQDSSVRDRLPTVRDASGRGPEVKPVWVEPAAPLDHRHDKDGRPPLTLRYAASAKEVLARSSPRPPGCEPAWLVVTAGVGPSKHMHCAIFEPDKDAKEIDVPTDMREQYVEDRAMPRAGNRQGRDLGRDVDDTLLRDGAPCFYLIDGGSLVFFGPTLFFRLPYRRSPSDAGVRLPSKGLDMASLMFGTVTPEPVKGRLRFDDGEMVDAGGGTPWLPGSGYTSPPQLLGPKPACIQHYLVQESTRRDELKHYDSAGNVTLRGFKFYWHRKGVPNVEQDPAAVETAQRKTRTVIRPVKGGVVFQGKVHFDNLTAEELGALLVSLELKPSMRHKLGMNRPFGYGSVRIEPTLHLLDPKTRYASFFGEGGRPGAGWVAPEERDRRAADARAAFAREQLHHLRVTDAPQEAASAITRLWEEKRMKDLAAMLEWDRAPNQLTTEPVSVQGHERSVQWKQRWLLPPPQALLGGSTPPPAKGFNAPQFGGRR